MFIFLIIGVLLGAATVVFALQNITTITVVFLNWQFEGSLALIIILAVGVGMLISSLLSLPGAIKKAFQVSSLKRHNETLKSVLSEKEVEVEEEKQKLATTNAYIDDLENTPKRI